MNITTPSQNIRTDLAIERVSFAKAELIRGVKQEKTVENHVSVTRIVIPDPSVAKEIGKPPGTYFTLEPTRFQTVPEHFEEEVEVLAKKLRELLPASVEQVLVVGLGNHNITPDALGPKTVTYTMATRHLIALREMGIPIGASVCAAAPGVLGQTGMESAEMIKSICRELHPDAVIAVDALAAGTPERLGSTVQLSDTGISPGSGVLNKRKELSRATLGAEVISIGVPTVVDLYSAAKNGEDGGQGSVMMVTPREIDVVIEHAAKLIGFGINRALHPGLSVEDIAGLVS